MILDVLNIINPTHMKMTNVFGFHQHGDRDDNLATSLHLHYGDLWAVQRFDLTFAQGSNYKTTYFKSLYKVSIYFTMR
jgi:hypothetical protein